MFAFTMLCLFVLVGVGPFLQEQHIINVGFGMVLLLIVVNASIFIKGIKSQGGTRL